MVSMRNVPFWSLVSGIIGSAWAISIDVTNTDSIKNAVNIAAENMLTFYGGDKPGGTPGEPVNGYYWWEAGAMFGQLIQRWHLTGNDSYNDLITQGMLFQIGASDNYEPSNQTFDLGNDDQAFWAFAALDAAELNFPNPPSTYPSWLGLAQAVYNRQVGRYDNKTCNGGLRWQVIPANQGYDYKNVASNGGLFQISARLARYTGNSSYADTANMLWNWMTASKLVALDDQAYRIYDGLDANNCTKIEGIQWTYNHATVLAGAAYMYNYTNGSTLWQDRLSSLVYGGTAFLVRPDNSSNPATIPSSGNGTIVTEYACESLNPQTCNQDQPAFKAFYVRWYAIATQLAPYIAPSITQYAKASAQAAAAICVGAQGTTALTATQFTTGGTFCGRRWYSGHFDGFSGYGEQMSAMAVFQNLLIDSASPPFTTVSGGTSVSNPGLGNGDTAAIPIIPTVNTRPFTSADRAGAWVLTILSLALCAAAVGWLLWDGDDWAGNDDAAAWKAVGMDGYYKRTAGFGAYRLAGLQTGGVYAKRGGVVQAQAPQTHANWWGHSVGKGSAGISLWSQSAVGSGSGRSSGMTEKRGISTIRSSEMQGKGPMSQQLRMGLAGRGAGRGTSIRWPGHLAE